MRSMKRLSIALIALGLSTPAFADNTVYIPSQHGGFKFSVDPLYTRNNVSDSNYDWGTFAQIGYLFPATGNDVTVNYTYLRSDEKASLNLDDANIEIGQRLTSGAFDIRLFSGIRYSHLNYELDRSTADNTDTLKSLFHGFGPRMGLDARYQLINGLGFDTHVNTALLAGTISTHAQNQSRAISNSITRLVPELEAKLGIDYTYPIPNAGKSAFSVEVGYQTTNYFHTFNSIGVGGSSDASFDGAYLDVKYYS